MSYILEALKKSEQERQRKSVPDLHTVHETPPARVWKRTKLPWLLALILLANGALATFLLLDRQHEGKTTISQAETGDRHMPLSTADLAVVQSPVPGDATLTAPELEKAPGVGPVAESGQEMEQASSLEEIPTAGQPAAEEKRPTQTRDNDGGEGRVDAGAQEIAVEEPALLLNEPSNAGAGVDFSSDRQNAEPDRQDDSSAPITDLPAPEEPALSGKTDAADRIPEIPFIDKLPAFVRSSLPEITISYHVYAHKPTARLVSINGKILREGQEVAPGLKLEEITSEGVILDYKGDRFRMKVF